jgi:hypothetical protein
MLLTSRQRTLSIGILLLHISILTHATIVVKGDGKSPTESFTHPIQKFIMNSHGLLYVGAITKEDFTKANLNSEETNKSGAKNYALALVNIQNLDSKFSLPEYEQNQQQEFIPAAPKKAVINGQKDMVNPLYNSHINHLAFMNQEILQNKLSYVAAVTKEKPASIYLLESMTADVAQMRSLENINDASGIGQTSSIAQLASGSTQVLYAAVTDHASANTFGEGNSGIAIVILQKQAEDSKQKEDKDKKDQVDKFKLVQIDYRSSYTNIEHPRAVPLNNESTVLCIGNPTIKILNNAINLDWSTNLDSLYIALDLHAQGSATDGCQAIVIGFWDKRVAYIPVEDKKTEDKKTKEAKKKTKEEQPSENGQKKKEYQPIVKYDFYVKPIALQTAFAPNVNNIVGGFGPDISVSIHQTKTMRTSTMLNYLVILGGIGKPEQTRHSVYALPVIKSDNVHNNGILAKKGSLPKTNYYAETRVAGRAFTEPASQPGDLYTADDIEIQVGHGPIIEGDITSIMVYGDTVYTVVTSADAGRTSGIYQSQAIFDEMGRIKEWTYWRRVYSSFTDHIYGAALNQATGTLVMLTGTSYESIHTVKRSSWEKKSEGHSKNLTNWLNSIFSDKQIGIQGLFDIPVCTPGLNNISLVIATGYKQIALAQTGVIYNDSLIPLDQNKLICNPKHYANGIIESDPKSNRTIEPGAHTNAIVMSGGALDELNVIKAAAITRLDKAGYVFVGGTHGLAVLINNDGCSFDASKGIGNNLSELAEGTIFKKIGSYSFIRKLICDHEQGLLYVVSDTALDRIDLKNSNFATNNLAVTRLVTYNDINNGIILDAVISRSLGILATSYGLYFSNTSSNIRVAQNSTDLQWQYVQLPQGLPTTRQIYCVSVTGREDDITSSTGGNIYILNTDQSKQKAQVYRFTINTTDQSKITVEPLPDYFVKDTHSYFAQLVGYRTWIYNDGSLFFNERDKHSNGDPILALLALQNRGNIRFGISSQSNVPIDLRPSSIIQPIVRSSASGSWMLAQDTMFSVNE